MMPTPSSHALLSASSAHRWLVCTPAPKLEEQFPSETSNYAEEGTLAHSICELYVQRKFLKLHGRTFKARLEKLQASPLYDAEMLMTAEAYVQHLNEKFLSFAEPPHLSVEVRVDLSEWVPEGFGTCDCAMIGGNTLHIEDYKHGKGVIVSAKDNPQMSLYALGALKRYRMIYGDAIKYVSMAICQPRISDTPSEYMMTADELLAWGESIKPIAAKAFNGEGEFVPGDHCRFCRAKAQCRARSNQNTALEDFKDCVTTPKANQPEDANARKILGMPPILTDAEIGDLLTRGAGLVQWYEDLKAYALQAILNGKDIPGYKVVAGKSNRAFKDADKALEIVIASGVDKAMIYDYKPKSLSEIEKILGKKQFAELLGEEVFKPMGKPTLADAADKREAYNSAAADFAGVTGDAG